MRKIDWTCTLVPLFGIIILCIVFMIFPESSMSLVNQIRYFIGDKFGVYYIILGISAFACSIYLAFSKYGSIRLGKNEKPEYSTFQWGTMIFTSTMAADILFYACCEWALYAEEPYIRGKGIQAFASTYPLFHWGPIAWSFYIILAVAFAFMLHVKGRTHQKYSEACRPILKSKTDGFLGKIIDLIAVFALLAGTATTFSLATPLLTDAIGSIFHKVPSINWSIGVLIIIAIIYVSAVIFGMKGISKLADTCIYLFGALLLYVFFLGGEAQYIIETGVEAIGNMLQNFIGMATYTDSLRENSFPQNWTIYYWAYWMAWCTATPFFIGKISKGRTVKEVILGGYSWGLAGTFSAFIVLGNYGLAQQMKYGLDISGYIADGGEISQAIIQVFQTLPLPMLALGLLIITMIAFYATTFDALTMVVASYSYKNLEVEKEPDKKMRVFWAFLFILFPIALLFSEDSLISLQSVAIIAAFPVGIVILLIIASFIKEAREYLGEGAGK